MDRGERGAQTLERMPTGIPGLDTIVGGGLPRGGIYLVVGEPGRGKTVLASQICFEHVRAGGRAVFATLLVESHARLLLNLGSMRFFDPEVVGRALVFVSGFRTLEEEGIKGLLTMLRRQVREHDATLLVLDGLVAATQAAATDRELKTFLQELQLHLGMMGCTALLLTTSEPTAGPSEGAMADGILELKTVPVARRRERRIELTKLRGTSYLHGEHTFTIGDGGIEVFPRIESLFGTPSRDEACRQRQVSTGVAELDELLGGQGFPCGTTGLVMGPSGSGKTIFGLQFMGASRPDAKGVYLSFYETPERACRNAEGVGVDLRGLVRDGIVELLWCPTTEHLLDDVGHRLVDAVHRTKAARVFVDGLDGLVHLGADPQRTIPFVTALANEFRTKGVTTLYTHEMRNMLGGVIEAPNTGVSGVVENMVLLRYVELEGRIRRLMTVTKVRDSAFDHGVREFTITKRGVEVGACFRGAASGLTGVPEGPRET